MPDKTNKIGAYILGKTLGVGTFSKVKIATHEPTGRKVAVKLINKENLKSLKMTEKANREIKNLRLFNHPHIIRLYEVIDSPTDLFVIMEYISGGELFEHIVSNKRLSESEARRFFQQIVSGIGYCHAHMVVHRDLKPENLLLDENMNVKIADFGLSNIMKDGFFLKTSCGSPNYAAPEIVAGHFYAGPEVDIWSCGVILFALICRHLPFDNSNIKELFKEIRKGDYSIPKYVSQGAKNLIKRMLEVDPLKRINLRQIYEDKWFCEDLPLNLISKPSLVFTQKTTKIDPEIMKELEEMGYETENLLNALKMGPDLLTKPSEIKETKKDIGEMREMVVAYQLLLDRKREKSFILSNESSKAVKKNSFGKYFNLSPKIETFNQIKPQDFPSFDRNFQRTRWMLGINCNGKPGIIMDTIFKTLLELNLDWKVLSAYRIKLRYLSKDCDEPIKIGIQLYRNTANAKLRMSKTVSNLMQTPEKCFWNRYTVDVQKIEGDSFVFMNICDEISRILNKNYSFFGK